MSGECLFRKSVGNCERCSTYKCGHLYRVYCDFIDSLKCQTVKRWLPKKSKRSRSVLGYGVGCHPSVRLGELRKATRSIVGVWSFGMCWEVDCVWNVMAHAQKPDFVFRRNGWIHLNRRGRQFSRLLAAEVCASAVVKLDTPCYEVVWRVLATHSICQFPLHFPSRASPCAITFQLDSTNISEEPAAYLSEQNNVWWRGNVLRDRMKRPNCQGGE